MNDTTHIIKLGEDPRSLQEFSAIREEVNKANHPSQPEVNWRLVESLALTLFKSNGVDLHSATYYTLARTRNNGLSGFCEGCELLAGLITAEWERFWPQNYQARTDMLEWFNSRVGNILRQNPSLLAGDIRLMHRTEKTLQLICDKLQQVDLKRIPRVENLLYFVQNIRKRVEAEQQGRAPQTHHYDSPTLVYMPAHQEMSVSTVHPVPPIDPLPQPPKVEVHFTGSDNKPRKLSWTAVGGFAAGIACSSLICLGLWWWQVLPMQQHMAQIRDTAPGDAALWLVAPDLQDYSSRLNRLLNVPLLQPLETGERMIHTATATWPESMLQQRSTEKWNIALKSRAENSPSLRGYMKAQQDLHAFSELLVQREKNKEGLTLSYLKTVAYQAETLLNQETPLEVLLTQYEDAKEQQRNTQKLEKQINERIEALSSRYLLVKQVNNLTPAINNKTE